MTIAIGTLLLVLSSSFAWSGLDTLRKALLREVEPVPLLVLLTVASVPPFALWVALTPGSAVAAERLLTAPYLLPAAGTVLLNLVANVFFMRAVRLSPLSLTIPLLSLTPVFATLLAIPLLGERPGFAAAIGVLLVVGGAFWLNAGRGFSLAALRREPGVPLMAMTALAWSLTIPFDKLGVRQVGAPLHGLVLNAGVALGLLALLAAGGRFSQLAEVRRVPGLFALGVAVSVLALGLQLLALSRVAVGLVDSVKRFTGNVMAVAMGRIVFGEAITPRKLLAALVMAAGVALILI